MSEIVGMLRSSADDMERNPGVAQRFSPQLLRRLANRIDAEMSENFRATDKELFSALLDFADRIRALAGKGDAR